MFLAIAICDREEVYCKLFKNQKDAIKFNNDDFVAYCIDHDLIPSDDLKQAVSEGVKVIGDCPDFAYDFNDGTGWVNHDLDNDWYVVEVETPQ